MTQEISKIQQALELLNELTKSGYIPFSSPCPSSTEYQIKTSVLKAIEELKIARSNEISLYNH